ncbi:MAG: hypothetical protein AABX12_03675 [Nanoarchaeota archaeon]
MIEHETRPLKESHLLLDALAVPLIFIGSTIEFGKVAYHLGGRITESLTNVINSAVQRFPTYCASRYLTHEGGNIEGLFPGDEHFWSAGRWKTYWPRRESNS